MVDPARRHQIVARGWTAPGGRPHAEAIAIEQSGGNATGCTLYVTLEPCSHHGMTPPCTDAIVKAGITRVVCAIEDPDLRVAGTGLAKLRDAGIKVESGVLAREAMDIAKGHVSRVTRGRPFVQFKIATGRDGKVPKGDGKPVWATGECARAHGHLMRARTDAILVGSRTVKADDPELTCRLPGMAHASPVRVILSANGAIGEHSRLFKTLSQAPLWCVVAQDCPKQTMERLNSAGAEVIAAPVSEKSSCLDLQSILSELANRGITRLLVEGGPTIAASFMDSGLVDEVAHYRGPEPVGAAGIVPFAGMGLEGALEKGWAKTVETHFPEGDVLCRYEREHA